MRKTEGLVLKEMESGNLSLPQESFSFRADCFLVACCLHYEKIRYAVFVVFLVENAGFRVGLLAWRASSEKSLPAIHINGLPSGVVAIFREKKSRGFGDVFYARARD